MTNLDRFDLYSRKAKNGKKIWYYRVYDEYGNRSSGKTTKQTSKTAAKQYVINLIKKGGLVTKGNPLFSEYAKDWWIWDKCQYIKRKLARGKRISPGYTDKMRIYLDRHILPYFGGLKLQKITKKMVEDWLFMLLEKPGKSGKSLTANTVNHCLTALRIMLEQAVEAEYMHENPARKVEQLKKKEVEKGIPTFDEVRELFRDDNIDEVWDGDLVHFTLNLLSASTGMRMGEIQGLQLQYTHKTHVGVFHSWDRKYGLKEEPKWSSRRQIPIPSKTSTYLQELISFSPYKEPDDLVFFGQDRNIPVHDKIISVKLYKAFENVGITPEIRKEKNVSFHSWRYLYNSIMRGKVHDSKLRKIIGHKSLQMSEHYTVFNLDDFKDVLMIQEEYFK